MYSGVLDLRIKIIEIGRCRGEVISGWGGGISETYAVRVSM